jgi:tetratricopeptide (TPR) repeat protein
LQQALEVDPAHELSELLTCKILQQQNRLEEALRHCLTATEILPDLRDAQLETAALLTRLGRDAEASHSRELAASAQPGSPRQYYYWARYLAQHGRKQAALAELTRALAALPNDPDVRALQAQLGGDSARVTQLSAESRATLVARLRPDAGSPYWLAVYEQDPAARALADELSQALDEAGWHKQGRSGTPFRPKPGLFVLGADESPPQYVESLSKALEAAKMPATIGRDYRAYYAERVRAQPDYQGFPLQAGQTYVLVVGPRAPAP